MKKNQELSVPMVPMSVPVPVNAPMLVNVGLSVGVQCDVGGEEKALLPSKDETCDKKEVEIRIVDPASSAILQVTTTAKGAVSALGTPSTMNGSTISATATVVVDATATSTSTFVDTAKRNSGDMGDKGAMSEVRAGVTQEEQVQLSLACMCIYT